MKADDPEPAVHLETVGNPPQGDFQRLEFLVDGNSQGLKGPSGGIDLTLLPGAGNSSPDDFRKLACRLDGPVSPPFDDRPSDPAAVAFLSIGVDQIGQVLGLETIDQPRSWLATFRVKPQVERPVGGETETAGVVGKLITRQSQVQNDSIHFLEIERFQHLRQITEIGLDGRDGQVGQSLLSPLNGRRIAVQRNDPSRLADPFRQGTRVSSAAKSPVDDDASLPRLEPVKHFGKQNGGVDGRGMRHR